jgi:hypothetical protein
MEKPVSDPSTASPRLTSNADLIEDLAQQTQRPIAEVRRIYEMELARLKLDARVADYLTLFASRRAREILSRSPR